MYVKGFFDGVSGSAVSVLIKRRSHSVLWLLYQLVGHNALLEQSKSR